MKRAFASLAPVVFLQLAVAAAVLAPVAAGAQPGPSAVANRFPLHWGLLTAADAGLAMPTAGRWRAGMELSYMSIHLDRRQGPWRVLMDMEAAVIEPRLEVGLTDRLALRLRWPFFYPWDGMLDGPLADYHEAFGFPDYGRSLRPHNRFAYILQKDGRDLFSSADAEGRLLAGDLQAELRWRLYGRKERGFCAAAGLAVQAPTGDTDTLASNGGWDAMIFFPMAVSGKRLSAFLAPAVAVNADPQTRGDLLQSRTVVSVTAAVAAALSDRWSASCTVSGYRAPFEPLGLGWVDDDSWQIVFALRKKTGFGAVEAALAEDLSRSVPDFTFSLAVSWPR